MAHTSPTVIHVTIGHLETENGNLKDQVVKLASECDDLEYSPRNNLIFTDIPESYSETTNGSNPEKSLVLNSQ